MTIQDIKNDLLSKFKIFRSNGFIYNTYAEFENGGVNDRLSNMFYLRQPISRQSKDQNITYKDNFRITTENWRLIAQLEKRVDPANALIALKAALEAKIGKKLTSASFDSDKVYAIEYGNKDGRERIIKSMNLLCVDFKISSREACGACGCIEDICADLCN